MSVLFLAASLSFIYADFLVAPNVNEFGDGVNDSVPYLRNASIIPWTKGVVKMQVAVSAVAAS